MQTLDLPEWMLKVSPVDLEVAELCVAGEKGRLDRSPRSNWVEQQGGLPKYIERIAVHLIGKGMSHSHAIAVAVNAAKRMCATGDVNFPGRQSVNPGSRAQACAAVAKWNAMRAAARARRNRR